MDIDRLDMRPLRVNPRMYKGLRERENPSAAELWNNAKQTEKVHQ